MANDNKLPFLLAAPRWEDEYLHAVPFTAKEPGVSLKDQQSGEALKIPWEEIIHKHVRTIDNVDILKGNYTFIPLFTY